MRKVVYAAFVGLGLLLAACGGPGGGGGNGGGGGGGNTVTVRLTDPQNALQGAYYRVGNGSWTQLTFTNGQATFQASGTYEVAARCGTMVQFYKATRDRLPVLPIVCSQEDTPGPDSVAATLNVSLPAQIGSVGVQDGDLVGAAGSNQPSNSGQATLSVYLPRGQQTVGLAVLRINSIDPTTFDVTPIGGKLVNLDIQDDQTYSVDSTGWVPFTPRAISATPPAGYGAPLLPPTVFFFKNDMKRSLLVGLFNRYGTFSSGIGGKYLGIALYGNISLERALLVVKDTGGGDWNMNLPAPWTTGQLSVSGATFTVTYPNAQAFNLTVGDLLKDSTDNSSLEVKISLLSGGSSTTYTLPDLGAQLGYQVDPDSERNIGAGAIVRGMDTLLNNPNFLELSGIPTTEDQLNGLDVAVAAASGSYTGDSYTLP